MRERGVAAHSSRDSVISEEVQKPPSQSTLDAGDAAVRRMAGLPDADARVAWVHAQERIVESDLRGVLGSALLRRVDETRGERKKAAKDAVAEKVFGSFLGAVEQIAEGPAESVAGVATVGLEIAKQRDAARADLEDESLVGMVERVAMRAEKILGIVAERARDMSPEDVRLAMRAGWFVGNLIQPGCLKRTIEAFVSEDYRKQPGVTASEQVDEVQRLLGGK